LNSRNCYDLNCEDDFELVAYILDIIYLQLTSMGFVRFYHNFIRETKCGITVKDLCEGISYIFGEFLICCPKLDSEEKPDYHYWRNEFLKQNLFTTFNGIIDLTGINRMQINL